MKLSELYKKPIGRAVNPAVSATKFDPETEKIEIEEYVFTDEIINGLYRILDAIKNNKPYDHVGIWIDGYYGSGKSHFLKYLDYYSGESFGASVGSCQSYRPIGRKSQHQLRLRCHA